MQKTDRSATIQICASNDILELAQYDIEILCVTPHVDLPCGTGATECWRLASLCCQVSKRGLAKLMPWNSEAFYRAKRLDCLSLLTYPCRYARPMHRLHSSHQSSANNKARIPASVSSATWHTSVRSHRGTRRLQKWHSTGKGVVQMKTWSQSFSLLDNI
jgi:hypothetical protein